MRLVFLLLMLGLMLSSATCNKIGQDIIEAPHTDEFDKYLARKSEDMEGKPAPDFNLIDLSGKTVRLSDFRGKTVLLTFWFKACVPCMIEIPSLKELHDRFAAKGLVILACTTDNAELARQVSTEHALPYRVLPNAEPVSNLFSVTTYPTNILIDRYGYMQKVSIGGSDFDGTQLYRELKPLIQEIL